MKRKALDATFATTAAGFEATITADTIDRDGEVVVPQGMNATEFEKNPVLFWNHDYGQPIGKCLSLTRGQHEIKGAFTFAKKPDGWEGPYFPEFVASLVAQGVVRGVSIGYSPEQGGMRRATLDDRKRYGDPVHTVYSKWKLLEISVAPLQANPSALITAVRKGAVNAADAERWLGYQPPRRVQVVVDMPVRASVQQREPIDVKSIAAREIARAKGKLWM
ncbi:MAG: HK97 family phage prohead protease [Burkholderiaceae bacterium]